MASCFSTTTRRKLPDRVITYVKPASVSEESKRPYYLSPWDLQPLSYGYNQVCLLFNKPDNQPIDVVVGQLKNSLATALTYFFPLSGRLVTESIQNPPSYRVYVDCNESPGAGFVHAVAEDLSISDISTPADVPVDIIGTLFGLGPDATNNQGHNLPLLAVQVTQLVDAVCIAFSINHCLVDGVSLWHFINSYSEICRHQNNRVMSHHPVTKRWCLDNQWHVPGSYPIDGTGSVAQLPSTAYRQRIFHFTSEAIAKLKTKANVESRTRKISSCQALIALVWRAVTRARGLRGDQATTCVVPVDSRPKLEPPLSKDYLGFCITTLLESRTVDELLSNHLGWAAWALHTRISSCDNDRVLSSLEQATVVDRTKVAADPGAVYFGHSPRFDVYGNDFGWGNPIAVRSYGDMVDGYVHVLPGRDKGSVDLIMCFFSKTMDALELDTEFMGALSSATLSKI